MKGILAIILFVLIIFVLSESNPERSEYIDWLNNSAMNQSSNLLEKSIFSVAGQTIFDAGTTGENYFIFSIYETDFSEVGMGKVKFIGVFNNFIPLSKMEQ